MRQYLRRAADLVRYAPWLTRERLLRWGKVCALLSVVLLAYDAIARPAPDVPIGRDFTYIWSSASLAAAGRPDAAYVVGPDHPFEQSLPYPPVILLLCLPFAALSYVHGLLVWVFLGAALYAWPLSRLVGWRMAALATFGTPAALWNLFSRQNGYFAAALLGWGLTLVERRPVTAGILLGTLCYKPQLGILVPVALAAGGHRRAFAAASATVALLVAASLIALGPDTWIAFLHRMVLHRRMMELAALSWTRMPTIFAMARLLGASLTTAYLAQVISAAAAATAVAALWHERCPLGIKSAGLVVATFLATPYAWDYDMVALIFAAAWLAGEAVRTGFRPWEKIAVLGLLTLPALSLGPARLLGIQIGPVLLWGAMVVILRRGLARSVPVSLCEILPPVAGGGRSAA